jgi:hypothetical protein
MNNTPVGGRSSETSSHPIYVNNNKVSSQICLYSKQCLPVAWLAIICCRGILGYPALYNNSCHGNAVNKGLYIYFYTTQHRYYNVDIK